MVAGFDINDPRNVWVAPERDDAPVSGMGTYNEPYASISDAFKKAGPGDHIILMPGVYEGDLTVEISGDERRPIYISSYETGRAIIEDGSWYFYDASDLVVSGLLFKNAKRGAISVVGQCLRNRFHSINFIDCGANGGDFCTFYFGGSGARFNIVENCEFSTKNATAGLMISDGGDGDFLMNHVIRLNRFRGYDKAIIIGAGNSSGNFESGHIVERNAVNGSRVDGITVKCRDVQVRGNIVCDCANAGINLVGGGYSVVESNRITNCGVGISASGEGHSAAGNTIANCESAAISANGETESFIILENTLVDCMIVSPNKGFIIGENKSIRGGDAYADDNDINDDADTDNSYIEAAIPDDVDDIDNDDGNNQSVISGEQESILNYMFNMGEWEK